MLCNISVPQNINEINKERSRPRIDIFFDKNKASWLFDTGASRTCMPEKTFRKMFSPGNRPSPLPRKETDYELKDAGGNDLGLLGTYLLTFNIRGRSVQHEVVVLKNLTDSILGADFMHRHHLSYDAYARQYIWADEPRKWTNAIFSASERTFIPALQTKVVKINTLNDQAQPCSEDSNAIAFISAQNPYLSNQPGLVKFNQQGKSFIRIQNCAPFDINIERNEKLGFLENCPEISEMSELNNEFMDKILSNSQITPDTKLSFEERKTRIYKDANIEVPEEYKEKYYKLLTKYSDLFSDTKYDLGRATHFFHKIHLKDKEPVYRKQFKIPDAHKPFLEENITEWLKLGVIQRSQSLYNSPVFCVPKKDGGLRIVQDFRELNKHSYMDKYSMKEINECIGDIGKANSTIFSTLDLTSGFWQMPLDKESRAPTAFTIPGLGQFEWVTSPMGLLGCPASFQRLMEMIFINLKNVIVYIDDLLVHSQNHEDHLVTLEETFKRLHKSSMKINLKKCFFGSREVSYLGFRLTPNGILPGKDKLKAIQKAERPKTVTEIKAFLGLCNFFRTHIKNFAQVASPLYILTRKDKAFNGKYTDEENAAFETLKKTLCSEPVMAYPRSDRTYALLVDAATGTSEKPGGIGAILTQIDDQNNFHAISYASRQLVTHEKNYSPFLLEMQGAVWGMDYFQEHLRGKRFILFTDHKPLEALSHIHTKTLNRLQLAMLDFDFEIQYKKGIEMPADYLSRTPVGSITSINPFTEELPKLQRLCKQTNPIIRFLEKKPDNYSVRTKNMAKTCFLNQNVLWTEYIFDNSFSQETKTLLFAPESIRRRLICEAHGKILTGHNGIEKTKQRLLTTYYWPNMDADIADHIKTCITCQINDKSKHKPSKLQSLPVCSAPNQRVHLDLFGAVKSSSNKNNYILCMTDAFSKYAEVVAIPNKEAPTVATEFFEKWICRYGVPSVIHTDGGKEFVNKLEAELCEKLEIKHSKNTPYHPQCNAQVEVFNKTVQKYLASVVNPSTLDWELYIAPLMFSYNTSFHATTKTSPFQLTYGMTPRLPSFPTPDLERKHYGEGFVEERMQLLEKARQIATEQIIKSGIKSEENFNKKTTETKFEKGQDILLDNHQFLKVNKKFAAKWTGPHEITKIINEKCVEIKLNTHNGRKLVVNIDRIKPFRQTIHLPDTDEQIYKNIDVQKVPVEIEKEPELTQEEYQIKQNIEKRKLVQQKYQERKERQNKFLINNRRVTRSMAKQADKLNLINENSIKKMSIKFLKSTLISAMWKTIHSDPITQDEYYLINLPISTKNQILQRDICTPFDIKEYFTKYSYPTFCPEIDLPPLLPQNSDPGYITVTPPTEEDSENEFDLDESLNVEVNSSDVDDADVEDEDFNQSDNDLSSSTDDPSDSDNEDDYVPDDTLRPNTPVIVDLNEENEEIEIEKSKNTPGQIENQNEIEITENVPEQFENLIENLETIETIPIQYPDFKDFQPIAGPSNQNTGTNEVFQYHPGHIRQKSDSSYNSDDFLSTHESSFSSNSSFTKEEKARGKELLRKDKEEEKQRKERKKQLEKEAKEQIKREKAQIDAQQDVIEKRIKQAKIAEKAAKTRKLNKEINNLTSTLKNFPTEKEINLQPDKITTRAEAEKLKKANDEKKPQWLTPLSFLQR